VRVPQAVLDMPLPGTNSYAFGLLSERADALLKRLESSQTTRGEVERLIAPMLHTGEVSIEAIAARMAVSQKTLYRRLKLEGATFEQVLDDLRHRLAESFLADAKVSVNEIAYLLGFSEAAAFSRAFKRWTGRSPGAIRKGS
jgi:AraC-like DNA-binding protein